MTLKYADYKDNYQHLPKIEKIKLLYHLGYWDGPLSGICEIDGEKLYFKCVEEWIDNNRYPTEAEDPENEFEPPWWRRFLIVRLTEQQLERIESRHKKFQRMVGLHTDYREDGTRSNYHYNETINVETTAAFYTESKAEALIEAPISMEPASDEHVLCLYEWK